MRKAENIAMSRDLVCQTGVDEDSRYFSEYGNETYYFCSAECKRKFDDHPDTFISEDARQAMRRTQG
jgi:YHS domain-containing protein